MKKRQGPAKKKPATKKPAPKKPATKKPATKKPAPTRKKPVATKKAAPARKKAAPAKKQPVKKKAAPAKKQPVKKKAAPAKKKAAPAKKKPATKKQPAKKKAAPAKKKAAPAKQQPSTAKKTAAGKKVAATPPPALAVPEVPVRTLKKGHVICELSGFEVLPGGPALAPKTIERLRLKLVAERERLLHQAEELAAEADQLAHDREAGDTQFDEESGEGDTVNVERERDLMLSASARNAVEEIDEALVRIKRGTYGFCSPAGKRLSLDRLEAFPWANVCVDCKARAERRR